MKAEFHKTPRTNGCWLPADRPQYVIICETGRNSRFVLQLGETRTAPNGIVIIGQEMDRSQAAGSVDARLSHVSLFFQSAWIEANPFIDSVEHAH